MYKFSDISKGALICLVILLIMEMIWMVDSSNVLDSLDENKDGVVSRAELKKYLEKMSAENRRKKIKKHEFWQNIISGIIRGILMGFVLQDLEGGMVLSILYAVMNPIATGSEKIILGKE